MSKWTLTRKTQAFPKSGLQILREGCFKMKLDDRKTEGATRFGFRTPIVKLQVEIRIERHYKTLWRLPDIFD